jgi:hypothetical protein
VEAEKKPGENLTKIQNLKCKMQSFNLKFKIHEY